VQELRGLETLISRLKKELDKVIARIAKLEKNVKELFTLWRRKKAES
jgi:hypothetical protein